MKRKHEKLELKMPTPKQAVKLGVGLVTLGLAVGLTKHLIE